MTEENVAKYPSEKVIDTVARKTAFSKLVESKRILQDHNSTKISWHCCGTLFVSPKDIHKHVSTHHMNEVNNIKEEILKNGDEDAKFGPLKKKMCTEKNDSNLRKPSDEYTLLPTSFDRNGEYSWLPKGLNCGTETNASQILLFYHYRKIDQSEHVHAWQKELCQRLNLTGKVRIAEEGLNVTVGGTIQETELYIKAVLHHPLFCNMTENDFKKSRGSAKDFPDGLKIGIYKEAVPMGVDPSKVSFSEACKHLTPEEFHQAAERSKTPNSSSSNVFIDCRNFYESKIGKFEGAVCPDIRKFSYWPEYVDTNEELFKDKNVYMYCTGGIRCERGSAYLRSKNICKDVFQLEGGIHKYIEKYPDGYFRGKLFVFDNRYHIKSNDDVISECTYCGEPWDKYEPCSSNHCHQLVLSCDKCRTSQNLTACCRLCQENSDKGQKREQCGCTKKRERVPKEDIERGNTESSSCFKTEIENNIVS